MDIIDVFVYLAFIVCGIFCILLGGIFILFFRKQYKKAFFSILLIPIYLLILDLSFCRTHWKYPDILLQNMSLQSISKIWGDFDVVLPETGYAEVSDNAAGYFLYSDEQGNRYYYFIQEVPDKEYNEVLKGNLFIENPKEFFVDGSEPVYFDKEVLAQVYEINKGHIVFPYQINESVGMKKMYDYLGITENEFLDYLKRR